jgi:hypothetical protein
MQRAASFLRDRFHRAQGAQSLSPADLNRRAREIVDDIDNETGNRTAHSQRVARLYAVARDIQHAAEAGAKEMSAYRIVAFLADVCLRSYLPRLVPR